MAGVSYSNLGLVDFPNACWVLSSDYEVHLGILNILGPW